MGEKKIVHSLVLLCMMSKLRFLSKSPFCLCFSMISIQKQDSDSKTGCGGGPGGLSATGIEHGLITVNSANRTETLWVWEDAGKTATMHLAH